VKLYNYLAGNSPKIVCDTGHRNKKLRFSLRKIREHEDVISVFKDNYLIILLILAEILKILA